MRRLTICDVTAQIFAINRRKVKVTLIIGRYQGRVSDTNSEEKRRKSIPFTTAVN